MNCPHCGSTGKNTGQSYKDGTEKYRCTKDGCRKYFRGGDIAEDTLSVDSENIRMDNPSRGKAGPKKVLNEAGKAIANNVASIVADSTQVKMGAERGLSFQEAQSIVHPTTRIAWRHFPEVAKDALPDIPGLEKEDMADLLEIGTTVAKYAIRRFTHWYHGWRTKQLNGSNPQVQHAVQKSAPAPAPATDIDAFFEQEPPDLMARSQNSQPAPSSNGHSPELIAALPGDYGMEG